jgi:hypothetical protein
MTSGECGTPCRDERESLELPEYPAIPKSVDVSAAARLSAKRNTLYWKGHSQAQGWPLLDLDKHQSVAHHNHRPRCGRTARPDSRVLSLSTLSYDFRENSYTPRTTLRRNNFRHRQVDPKPIHSFLKPLEQWKQLAQKPNSL